jgi:hypothetical protein
MELFHKLIQKNRKKGQMLYELRFSFSATFISAFYTFSLGFAW